MSFIIYAERKNTKPHSSYVSPNEIRYTGATVTNPLVDMESVNRLITQMNFWGYINMRVIEI